MLAIEEADIIFFLLDGRGMTPADHEVVDILRRTEKPVFHIVNKIDGPEKEIALLAPFYELGIEQLWALSAEHSYGFQTLMEDLVARLGAVEDEADSNMPDNTVKVAFIGRPNVGKSSMINTILGEERMVVSEVSGTTRDSVDTLWCMATTVIC